MDDLILWSRSILLTTVARWKALAETTPQALLTRIPARREWSAYECLYHLLDTEQVFYSRVHAFLAGQDLPGFDPDTQGTPPERRQPPVEAVAEFQRLRAQSLELLDGLSAADLTRQVRHQDLGLVKLAEMVAEWAAHDLVHTMQAEKALMQPFIHASGPWIKYFAEHVIAPDA